MFVNKYRRKSYTSKIVLFISHLFGSFLVCVSYGTDLKIIGGKVTAVDGKLLRKQIERGVDLKPERH